MATVSESIEIHPELPTQTEEVDDRESNQSAAHSWAIWGPLSRNADSMPIEHRINAPPAAPSSSLLLRRVPNDPLTARKLKPESPTGLPCFPRDALPVPIHRKSMAPVARFPPLVIVSCVGIAEVCLIPRVFTHCLPERQALALPNLPRPKPIPMAMNGGASPTQSGDPRRNSAGRGRVATANSVVRTKPIASIKS